MTEWKYEPVEPDEDYGLQTQRYESDGLFVTVYWTYPESVHPRDEEASMENIDEFRVMEASAWRWSLYDPSAPAGYRRHLASGVVYETGAFEKRAEREAKAAAAAHLRRVARLREAVAA